ncbi:MAG: UDP-glucose 4-epimerase GalE [Candidatus Acidiferrales bacterium]
MQRILVTGGAGYVGSVCVAQLLARGFAVDVIDDVSTGHIEAVPPGAEFHRFDLGNREALTRLLASKQFDVAFHFAAKALVGQSMADPGLFFDVNVARSVAMLEVLREHRIRKFVFSSTAAVYGNPQTVPIPEDHPKNPVNPYGESKLMFEHILRWYAKAYDWSVVAFRYFNASGGAHEWGESHEPETHIIPILLQVASGRRQHFDLFGTDWPTPDGTCLRDYIHVSDIADAHILALKKMESPGFHVYNIGTGQSHSVREVWRLAEEVTQKKIAAKESARRPGDPAILCANPAQLKSDLGWTPKHTDLKPIIQGAWEWEQVQSKRTKSNAKAGSE